MSDQSTPYKPLPRREPLIEEVPWASISDQGETGAPMVVYGYDADCCYGPVCDPCW